MKCQKEEWLVIFCSTLIKKNEQMESIAFASQKMILLADSISNLKKQLKQMHTTMPVNEIFKINHSNCLTKRKDKLSQEIPLEIS